MSYKREEVFKATLKYFGGDELAANVWIDKYCLKHAGIYYELTPEDMHRRLAKEFARIEAKFPNPMSEEEIFELFKKFKYIVPQGSPMAGIGNNFMLSSISNCFVIGNGIDSYGGIMRSDEEQVQLMKRRGGVGQDISHIRPSAAFANGATLGKNSGSTLYMHRYSNSTREVQQDGRRGALMLSISIKHPDAEQFIDEKMTPGKVTGANVSVRMSDEFMNAVLNGSDFIQTFPVDLDFTKHTAFLESLFNGEIEYGKLYDLKYEGCDEYKGCYAKRIDARKLWAKIIHNAWKSAEPGILFWDTILRESPAFGYGAKYRESSTNPCFTGDTLVAVADGRRQVTFKELAEAGGDVLVYCANDHGETEIRMMRSPRKTAENVPIVKVLFENGGSLKCTPNHKFYLQTREKVEAESLKQGMTVFSNSYPGGIQVQGVFECGTGDVYNGTVDDFHNYFVVEQERESAYGHKLLTCCLVANCGEVPLNPYDSCRLMAINLYSYVHNAFLANAQLEDELLIDHVHKAMRLIDDIVELEIEKIDAILNSLNNKPEEEPVLSVERELWLKIKDNAMKGRRTGLGVLGEADLIAAIGYTYGTPEATLFSEKLHQLIATAAYSASTILAEERGAFLDFDLGKEKGGFLNRMYYENELMTDAILDRLHKFGRRNIGMLTIAPTGTTSLMTQTSSGIEPCFSPYYFRKKKSADGEDFDVIDEVGDKFKEFVVFHKPFIDWYAALAQVDFFIAQYQLSRLSKEELEKVFNASPYYKATAQDVDYVEKVRMQGAVQKWVDHSISVTVNMPESVTEDIVDAVYKQAWSCGCKGITVYRENSRGNVLATESVKVASAEHFDYVSAIKRPKEVSHDVYFKSARNDEFIIFVGIISGKPYEVFAIPSKSVKMPKNVKKGTITKVKKGVYKFTDESGKYVIDNVVDHMIESEQTETRNVSAMLRHRINPEYIVNDVLSQYATISSFHKVIEKVIREYITESEDGNKCPECGGKIHMTEGCLKCVDCGFAKCG